MNTDQHTTIPRILQAQAERIPQREAVLSPDRKPLTYGRLYEHICQIVETLNGAGLGRGDRVGLVIPDGPEMLVAVLSITSTTTGMFFKTSLRPDEFESLFKRAHLQAVIIQQDIETAAREAAQACNLSIIELIPRYDAEAGLFTLSVEKAQPAVNGGLAEPDDLIWIASSSGTTALQKLIPLTQRMMYLRMTRNTELHGLNENDRQLTMKPLHIASTYNTVIGLLTVGGTVIAAQGFDGARFFEYLDTFHPTFCVAPATMWQSVLVHAPSYQDEIARSSLRFMRAGSMALPPTLKEQLEAVFKVPVLQTYGGSETGNIASNLLPPEPNKPGSAGRLSPGKEIRVADSNGNPVAAGVQGEIIVRGPEVMTRYDDELEPNPQSFFGDWFRTGDVGYVDSDNYLFLTGRLKEQINRGGEKVSPVEVETALLLHPVVAEAAVFAIPDKTYGEQVGAAVVLKPSQAASEKELRVFVSSYLIDFKVPRRVVFVDTLPRTALGKVQRIGLAEKLGITLTASLSADDLQEPAFVGPRTPIEVQLAQLWDTVLGKHNEPLSIHDEFIQLGGDSLAATRLISRIRKTLNVEISLLDFFDSPTIAQQALILEKLLD